VANPIKRWIEILSLKVKFLSVCLRWLKKVIKKPLIQRVRCARQLAKPLGASS